MLLIGPHASFLAVLKLAFSHPFFLFNLSLSFSLSLSVPNVNMMDQRLGSLAQEFRDLVYPADYNPEGKTAPKRKPGEKSIIYISEILFTCYVFHWRDLHLRLANWVKNSIVAGSRSCLTVDILQQIL